MVLKRRFSYQWRIFLPIVLCLWGVIFGVYSWAEQSVREVRNEMAYDQMDVLGSRLVEDFAEGDTARIRSLADFANRYYSSSENYDPMCVWVMDTETGKVEETFGKGIKPTFRMPGPRRGVVDVPREYQLNDSLNTSRYIYSAYLTPDKDKLVYVMMPYTKRLQATISSRNTYFWLMCLAAGLLATIVIYICIALFMRSLKMLRGFVAKASSSPMFSAPKDMKYPNDEMGDIIRQVIKIYNQRMDEIARREREHKVALNAIEDRNRIKRELTGNINHELKTPIGVIKGYIDTLASDPDMPEETRRRFILKTQQSVDRLTSLVQDITAITKLESGGKLVNITDLNFHDLIFSFENFVAESGLLQDKMTFSFDIPLDCHVMGNESLLTTVLTNLVKNAVAYSEGTECHLLHIKEDDEFHYFKFYDNGIGVPPEHLPHMFERFYRVNAGRSRSTGGTGLGLAIVEVTIESFGGEVTVMNHFPSGLEYNFTLPKRRQSITGQNYKIEPVNR